MGLTGCALTLFPEPPLPPATTTTVLTEACLVLLTDPTGVFSGAQFVRLPPVSAANRGEVVIIKNVAAAGAGSIVVFPVGADTIDGVYTSSSGVAHNVPHSTMTFISDGVDRWLQTNVAVYAPPAYWVTTVPIAADAELSADLNTSVNFDDIQMVRPGSVVGIRTRLTGNVTAGTLTVGVNTPLGGTQGPFVVHTNADNTEGGSNTQAIGLTTYDAGTPIGIVYITTPDFEPADTLLMEVWIEVSEYGIYNDD